MGPSWNGTCEKSTFESNHTKASKFCKDVPIFSRNFRQKQISQVKFPAVAFPSSSSRASQSSSSDAIRLGKRVINPALMKPSRQRNVYYICTFACTVYIYLYVCMYIYMCVYRYTYMYIYINIHIQIYT